MQTRRDPTRKGRNGIERALGRPAKAEFVRLFEDCAKLQDNVDLLVSCACRSIFLVRGVGVSYLLGEILQAERNAVLARGVQVADRYGGGA